MWSIQLWLLLWTDNTRNPGRQPPYLHHIMKRECSFLKYENYLFVKNPSDFCQIVQDEQIVLYGPLKSIPLQ